MLQCGNLGSGHLPILFGIVFFINLGCTYVFAVWHADVDPIFPYVSAAGDHRPESCFFGLLLNICSFLSMLIIYLRYELVSTLSRQSDETLDKVNRYSLFFGIVGGAAMAIVANFQETAVIIVHLSAACVCFGSGCIYMWLQTWVTIRMHPLFANRRIGYIRLFITITSTTAFFVAVTFGTIAAHIFHSYYPDLPTPRPWSRKMWQPGYELHVISAMAEWLMAIMHIFFIVSYSRDFEKIRVRMNIESLVAHLDHSPILRRSIEDFADVE